MPPAPPGPPLVLRTERADMAGVLGEILGFVGVRVETGPTPTVREAIDLWTEERLGSGARPFLSAYEPSELAAYFEAAKRFFEMQPWKRLGGTKYVALRIDGGHWVYANVTGQMGQVPGLALFERWLDLCRFLHNMPAGPALLSAAEAISELLEAPGGMEGLSLYPLYALDPRDADCVRRLGWRPLQEDLYPLVFRYTAESPEPLPPRVPLPVYTLMMEGIVRLVTGHKARRPGHLQAVYEVFGKRLELRYPSNGDEEAPAEPGSYRVASGPRIRGKRITVEAQGSTTLAELAHEFGLAIDWLAPISGFGSGDAYLWTPVRASAPAPRVYHVHGLEDFCVQVGRTTYPLRGYVLDSSRPQW